MNRDVLLIVLTDNSWLYAGLAALLPEMVCLQTEFCAHRLPREVRNTQFVVIAVDSRILFRGEWNAFNALQALRPDATVVWLTREETGWVFPAGSRGERIVSQQQDIVSLRLALRRAWQWEEPRSGEERVTGNGLTLTERRLLPFFLSRVSVPVLSRLTGRPVNTLYAYRHKILAKTGFRQLTFLQFVYERNRGLPGIPGLEHTDAMPPTREGEGRIQASVPYNSHHKQNGRGAGVLDVLFSASADADAV